MKLFTIGKNYYKGYIHNMYITKNIGALSELSAKEYYKIIFIESGPVHINVNLNDYILSGANIIFLNELDDITLHKYPENQITVLFFKPSMINSKFDFTLCNFPDGLSISERQDMDYLINFKHNTAPKSKILPINSFDSLMLSQKMIQLNDILTLQNTCYWPCRSRANLIEILFFLSKTDTDEDFFCSVNITPSYSKLTIQVINHLQTCYSQKITADMLSHKFLTNRTTLLMDFKKSTGISINQYVMKLRINIASALLRNTLLSINEICERVGFSNISYFCKSFKKETKHTPSDFRNIYCKA